MDIHVLGKAINATPATATTTTISLQVAGRIALEVTDVTTFSKDPAVKRALTSSIAQFAGVTKDRIQVALSAVRRLVGSGRHLGTDVIVDYLVTYPFGVDTTQKATAITNTPNAIMQIGEGARTLPNLRATQVELYEGLVASSVKGWPSVNFDISVVNNYFGRVFSAGFYYKTFMRPKKLWHLYEKLIRKSAGLGKAPTVADPDTYTHLNAHCDVLIAGAGPAGLMAALAAAKSGARVILADEQFEFGGSLLSSDALLDGQPASDWVADVTQTLKDMDNVTLLPRSSEARRDISFYSATWNSMNKPPGPYHIEVTPPT